MEKKSVRGMFSKFLLFVVLSLVLAAIVFAVSSFNTPNNCVGQWTNCLNAFADNANRATARVVSGVNKSGTWYNYGINTGNGAIIHNVAVRADFFSSKPSGFINVRVSGDGGKTYGPSHIVGGNTAEQTFLIDVTNDAVWNGSMLSNFPVNVTCFKNGRGNFPKCNLDWIPVNVTYTPFDFLVSASPSNDTVLQGNNVTTTVRVALLSGNSQTVNLINSGCPPNASCSFNASTGNPTYTSQFKVQTSYNGTTPLGTYNITLSGYGDGKSRSILYILNVNASNVTDSQPVASVSAVPTSGVAPLTVNFTGSVAGGDAPLSYLWDFNDSSSSSQQNPPLHTFNLSGDYNVSFKAIDFDNDSSTDYVFITVS